MVSNSQPSISIFRMSMWVWPEKILMIVVNVKSNSKKGDLREMDAPFFRISDSRVNMGGSSWGLSEPANPTALKCVRWARLKGISGPKDLTLKSYPQIWQWSVLARISASNDDSRLIPVILDVRFWVTLTNKQQRTEGIDDTIWLLCNTGDTAHPFTTISKSPETFNLVWAVECGREKVP